ncbi:MAG: peptidase [Sphingomonadales bacterium]|nr:peptidase [Sphingomonadales bacterium]
MKTNYLIGAALFALASPALAAPITPKAGTLPSPAEAFPTEPGSDYYLANYDAYEKYLKTLAATSDRMKLIDIGKSAEGRTMWVAIVSSPANLARLDHYREIARKLAKAEGVNEAQAKELAAEGRAVVWIDAGLHATETVTTQSQIHVLYRMLTAEDAETRRLLDDTIILFGHDNPDGLQLVADWYMRNADPKKREFKSIPRLYQKYVGHDNNRDSFMAQMPETVNVNRMLFREWFPQIIFNQHQTGPAGMVVFVPPFRDPFNYNYSPIVMTELQELGAAMHSRLVSEEKPGSGMRSAAPYSTWHNGMERSVAYFHNSIGLLTEIIGGPTPEKIPLVPDTQLARNDEPLPIGPREWHLKDSLEYQYSLDRAVLDYASRNRERLLMNIWRMGNQAIARGNRDSWTITPRDVDAVKAAAAGKTQEVEEYFRGPPAVDAGLYKTVLNDPAKRDPRGYILTPDQRDLPTTIAFLNALLKNGVDIERATKAFTVAGKSYPAGSYVVKTAQAYRPHVLDMFEPQDHPHDAEYPGGPPKAPYDITGYTLAWQMGVQFDRVLDGFDGPFERVTADLLQAPAGKQIGTGGAGWIVGHETNNGFILTNRLLKAGVKVTWLTDATKIGGKDFAPGAIWIPASAEAAKIVAAAAPLGIDAYRMAKAPAGRTIALKPVRIGLVDNYGGVIPAGWTRWLLEQYEFPFSVVYPKELDAGDLNAKFDVLLFADGTVTGPRGGAFKTGYGGKQPDAEDIPADYRGWLGKVSGNTTAPRLTAFVQAGGTVITVGGANYLASLLSPAIRPALVNRKPDGSLVALDHREFYIPGSLVAAKVDPTKPLAFGMTPTVDMFFDQNQPFTLGTGATPVAWFDSATPLRSGWAVGQDKLKGTVAIADADLGRGKVFALGTEVTQRAQPYATFKLLFNGILYGPAAAAER